MLPHHHDSPNGVCAGLDEGVEAFRARRLDHIEFPYVYLDATYLNVRNSLSQPASMATVVATGITSDGNREILGCDVGDSESEAFWQQFLASLKDRGLAGVRLVISDAHRGLAAAADRWFQGAAARAAMRIGPTGYADPVPGWLVMASEQGLRQFANRPLREVCVLRDIGLAGHCAADILICYLGRQRWLTSITHGHHTSVRIS